MPLNIRNSLVPNLENVTSAFAIFKVENGFPTSSGLSRGFHTAAEYLDVRARFAVVYASETYPRNDGVWVCNLPDFLDIYMTNF